MKKNTVKNILIALICVLCVAGCVAAVCITVAKRSYGEETGTEEGSVTGTPSEIDQKQRITLDISESVPAELDAERIVKQGYELRYDFGISSFEKPEDISVSAAVQYAFCTLYAGKDCVSDIIPGNMLYREATADEITAAITKIFGSCPMDITKSDLYVPAKNGFEMWQPNYYAEIYAVATVRPSGDGEYEVTSSYYTDESKTVVKGTLTVTVKEAEGGSFYLAGLSSK